MKILLTFICFIALSNQLSNLETVIMIYDSARGIMTALFADIGQESTALCFEDLSGITRIIQTIQNLTQGNSTTKSTIVSIFNIIASLVSGYNDCSQIMIGFQGIITKMGTISKAAINDPTGFIAKLAIMFFSEIATFNYTIAQIKAYCLAGKYYNIGLAIGDTSASFFLKMFP